MNELSTTLVTLSQEVLSICEQHHIPCILSDDTAHAIMKNGYDLTGLTSLSLLVRTDDFDKLFDLLASASIPNRGVEGMKTNNLYPTFSMYYVDTNTTCYLDDPNYSYHCAGIHILPLRKKLGKFRNRFYARLERWQLGIGKALYPKLLSVYKIGNKPKAFVQYNEKKRFYFSVNELNGVNRLFASGNSLPISSLKSERAKASCKVPQIINFRAGNNPQSDSKNIEVKQASFFSRLMNVILRRGKKYLKRKLYPINKDWEKLQCVNARYTLKAHYEKKLPLIRELDKNQDTNRLKEELELYHKKLNHYYRTCGITIKFDTELFGIYQRVYLKNAKKSHVKALIRHIPKVWR